jgi:hypothetical protein
MDTQVLAAPEPSDGSLNPEHTSARMPSAAAAATDTAVTIAMPPPSDPAADEELQTSLDRMSSLLEGIGSRPSSSSSSQTICERTGLSPSYLGVLLMLCAVFLFIHFGR